MSKKNKKCVEDSASIHLSAPDPGRKKQKNWTWTTACVMPAKEEGCYSSMALFVDAGSGKLLGKDKQVICN